MNRPFDIVTFDCYGTLIDWEEGISRAFLRAAREDGIELRREEVLRAYALIEPVVQRERFRSYADVLTESAARAAHALGWRLAFERGTFLVTSVRDWEPFPDTNPALDRLAAAGYRIGILSNVDDDLLAMTLQHLNVRPDLIVTAEQVHSYKPGHAHFLEAKRRIGDSRWLHAAQSNLHDIVPANALGIPTAWINRHGEKPLPGGEPSFAEVRTLEELLR
jgi:2-haloalkanoic acid dehalogenase type II